MQETAQQYTARIIGNLKGKDPLSVLKGMPSKIAAAIKDVPTSRLRKRPAPGVWSITEIIAHLAETELVLGWRYRSIIEKNGVPLQPFEQDLWAKNSRYQQSDVRAMLEMYRVLRTANLRFLSGLNASQWKKFGLHQERGKETIAHIVRLEAGHDINHFNQIRRILDV
ncbi:MAG: DinB family protein [Bacteroidetes bacterium]|nr:DinB family protein [Bacteroidota bacterium]